jgi:hypothetical protein
MKTEHVKQSMRFGSSLLKNQLVINWCFEPATTESLLTTSNSTLLKNANNDEKAWARSVIGGAGSQWTTLLCQELVREALVEMGCKNVSNAKPAQASITGKRYHPDLECDDFVYEVKGRSWSTSGTAGEKILGVPLKYGEVPALYKKPLQIVLVGYQEHEARKGFAFGDLLNSGSQTSSLRETLHFFKERNIEYIGFTDMLKQLGYGYQSITSDNTTSVSD